MHPTHAALLRAICESPADDLPRLVLADWLEETGSDPVRAEFIRLQIELAGVTGDDAHSMPLELYGLPVIVDKCDCHLCRARQRVRDLIGWGGYGWCDGAIGPDWHTCGSDKHGETVRVTYTRLSQGCGPFEFTFSRGFASKACCPMQAWLDHGSAVVLAHPVTDVKLSDRTPWNARASHDVVAEWCWHHAPNDREYVHPTNLRRELFDLLPGGMTLDFHDCIRRRVYPSHQEALDALSAAAVALARQKAGLPPLPA